MDQKSSKKRKKKKSGRAGGVVGDGVVVVVGSGAFSIFYDKESPSSVCGLQSMR